MSLPWSERPAVLGTLTPAQLLKRREQLGRTPSHHGLGWQALSEVLEDVAWAKCGLAWLHVHCMPGACERDMPGLWQPERALVSLEGSLLPVDPQHLDLRRDADLRGLATLYGVYIHECGHAVHTTWTLAQLPEALQHVGEELQLLEEVRMEAAVVQRSAQDRQWLRAASLQLDLGQAQQIRTRAHESARELAWRCALIEGRVVAGVLEARETARFSTMARRALGPRLHSQLLELLGEAVRIADGDVQALAALAKRLQQLVPEHRPQLQIGSQQLSEAQQAATDDLHSVAQQTLQLIGSGSSASKLSAMLVSMHDHLRSRNERSPAPLPAPADAAAARPQLGRILWKVRRPTRIEYLAAQRLAVRMRQVSWRAHARERRAYKHPPGRLIVRAAMRAQAQLSMGLPVGTKPWSRRTRTVSKHPIPRVGILADTSRSMASCAPMVSSCTWMLSHAVHQVGGRVVSLAFGDSLAPLAPLSGPASRVLEFEASGGTGFVVEALAQLHRELDLANPAPGPRVVVIVSDGEWDDLDHVNAALTALTREGVEVVLVDDETPPQHPHATSIKVASAHELSSRLGALLIRALS
jgi:hypothetical protein